MNTDNTYQSLVVTPSADIAVTLDSMRMHLRLDELTYEDELLLSLIRAATQRIEREYSICVLDQTVKQYHCAFPESGEALLLRISPLSEITTVKYYDSTGTEQTWSSDYYSTGYCAMGAFIEPKVGKSYPSGLANISNAVTVTYVAGYSETPNGIPDDIAQAIKQLVADMHAHRDNPKADMPRIVDVIMHAYWKPKA